MKKKYFLEKNDLKWFKNNYSQLGGRNCSKALDLPIKFLHKTASKLKLKVNKEIKSLEQSKRAKDYSKKQLLIRMRESKKIKIDSPSKAYTFGFLWGDGYLNHPKQYHVYYPVVGIVKEDFNELINTFKCLGKWHLYYRKRKNRKDQGEGYLCNPVIGLFLKENNYIDKSTCSPSKILSLIPNNLKHYWWRGYIDADGCFYHYPKNYICQFSIAGSYNQNWDEAEKLFKNLNVSYYKINKRTHENYKTHKNAKDSVIRITNKKDILKIGNYIFKGIKNIGLKRKYNKFLSIAVNG